MQVLKPDAIKIAMWREYKTFDLYEAQAHLLESILPFSFAESVDFQHVQNLINEFRYMVTSFYQL